MIQPLNNCVLIEVMDDNEGLITSADENVQKGKLLSGQLIPDHLTASTGYLINNIEVYAEDIDKLVGKIVYWQEYADSGSKFKQDGKDYVLVPFYRLIGWEA